MATAASARFRALDADSDGRVTLAEVQPAVAAVFRAFDENGDGVITKAEADAARPHHRGHRRD
jgi:Ca2+-binding EF-hand superfamily protein